jgi:hypothetical protein
MLRALLSILVLALALDGCASQERSARSTPPGDPQFTTEEQKLLACLDLQDHIVDLYAEQYVKDEGVSLSRAERTAFRDGWAEELAKRGTFERFEQSCFYGLTPRKYRCGMQSETPDGLVACMKLTMREPPRVGHEPRP